MRTRQASLESLQLKPPLGRLLCNGKIIDMLHGPLSQKKCNHYLLKVRHALSRLTQMILL